MFYRSLLFSSVLILGACSYVVDKQIQEITFTTPGAYNTLCYAYVEGTKFKIVPPQTRTLPQSREDLIVDCMAPGNRRKKVVVEPTIPKSFIGNIATGVVPGAVWDYTSEAMFKYPSIIEVNFVNTQVTPEALPAQNQPDIKQPEEYPLEEFLPGSPRLNSDRYAVTPEIKRREKPGQNKGSYVAETITEGVGDSKSNPDVIVDSVGADINPAGDPTPTSGDVYGPVPLYPGQ